MYFEKLDYSTGKDAVLSPPCGENYSSVILAFINLIVLFNSFS